MKTPVCAGTGFKEGKMIVLYPFFRFLIFLSEFLMAVIFIQVIFSWLLSFGVLDLRNQMTRQIAEVLHKITAPFYAVAYKILPPMGGVDFAPLVLWFVLMLFQRVLWKIIVGL